MAPRICVHTGMVTSRAQAVGLERLGHIFGIIPAEAVDDGGSPAMTPQHFEHLSPCIDAWNDPVEQVGTIESADQHQWLAETKLLENVGAHALRGGRGVCVNACLRKTCLDLSQLAIFRPEVVTPLADAVRFIDGEGANFERRDELEKSRRQ